VRKKVLGHMMQGMPGARGGWRGLEGDLVGFLEGSLGGLRREMLKVYPANLQDPRVYLDIRSFCLCI